MGLAQAEVHRPLDVLQRVPEGVRLLQRVPEGVRRVSTDGRAEKIKLARTGS